MSDLNERRECKFCSELVGASDGIAFDEEILDTFKIMTEIEVIIFLHVFILNSHKISHDSSNSLKMAQISRVPSVSKTSRAV